MIDAVRLWILSDLHIESCTWDLPEPRPDYDVLIAAGDILTPASRGVEWLAERANGKPVIYVPGNHEWYAPRRAFSVQEEALRAAEAAARLGVHFLMRGSVVLGDVRFLGATLWTDYAIQGDVGKGMAMAQLYLNDHRMIYPEPKGPRFTPYQARDWHVGDRAWLEGELSKLRPVNAAWTKTVVVTHHLPHPESVAAQYANDPLNPAFCSDLSQLVESSGAALWVHGHTHASCDYLAGRTRVVCNPKGYGPVRPGAPIENKGFEAGKVLAI